MAKPQEGILPEPGSRACVVIEEKGEELDIMRHSFPYGDTSAAGLFFIALRAFSVGPSFDRPLTRKQKSS